MKIRKAMILCAGYGKRLIPLTEQIPKPLLKVGEKLLLEYSLKFLETIGIKEIVINTHHLYEQFNTFIKSKNFNIKTLYEKDILDTGGGIFNAVDFFENENFVVLNSDTIWQKNYLNAFSTLEKRFFDSGSKGAFLLCKPENSFDKNLKGDFDLNNNYRILGSKKFIYTGCQILNPSVFQNTKKKIFSIKDIWSELIEKKEIIGELTNMNFFHVTNYEIYQKLKNRNFDS